MTRVLVLGLDSADAELIERWADAGHLPTFAALRREGTWGRLGTTAEVLHVSAWPTIYTGARPGHHGLYHAYQARAGTQALHRTRVEWGALPAFWQLLDRAGRRCLVMDAFMDRPLEDFGGTQIVEYGTWTWFSDPGGRPKQLYRELMRRFGPYPAPEHSRVLTVPDPAWFRDQLVAGARRKGEVVRWLLDRAAWDLAFIGFGEPHGAGHYLWHLGDESYPSHPRGAHVGHRARPARRLPRGGRSARGHPGGRRRGHHRPGHLGGRNGAQLLGVPPHSGSAAPDGAVPWAGGRRGRGAGRRAGEEGRARGGRAPGHSAESAPGGDPLPAAERPLPVEHEVGQLGDRLGALPGVLHSELERGVRPGEPAGTGAPRHGGARGDGRAPGPDRGAGWGADRSRERTPGGGADFQPGPGLPRP